MQNKWKNIKAKAKQRNRLIRQALKRTGGGSLKPAERQIAESTLYNDVVAKLGIAPEGNLSRFDSDASVNVVVPPPTARLRRVMSLGSQSIDSDVNMGSHLSLASTSASQCLKCLYLFRCITNGTARSIGYFCAVGRSTICCLQECKLSSLTK